MKTRTMTLMAVTILGLSVLIASAEEKRPGWFRRTFCDLTWSEMQIEATHGKTPQSICASVRHHLYYKEDLGDEWASGMDTWNRGFGDCEDYAACVVDLCKAAGIQASIQIFYPAGSWEGHAVVVGTWKDRLWISSNGWYETVKSLDRAERIVARDFGWGLKRKVLVASAEDVRKGTVSLAASVGTPRSNVR